MAAVGNMTVFLQFCIRAALLGLQPEHPSGPCTARWVFVGGGCCRGWRGSSPVCVRGGDAGTRGTLHFRQSYSKGSASQLFSALFRAVLSSFRSRNTAWPLEQPQTASLVLYHPHPSCWEKKCFSALIKVYRGLFNLFWCQQRRWTWDLHPGGVWLRLAVLAASWGKRGIKAASHF